MNKRILDPCCGSKMFWFDKNNPDVEFCDIRTLEKTEYYPGRYIEIAPDTVCDFTDLPFEDNVFIWLFSILHICNGRVIPLLWQ